MRLRAKSRVVVMHPKRNFDKPNFEKKRVPHVVGAERNAFGTRLCQRIECSRCHKVDYVAKKITGAKIIYCRSCAERFLESYESGRIIAHKQIKRSCGQCKKEFEISEALASKKDITQCRDCFRGFEVWRGKMSGTSHNKEYRALSLANGARTIVRKNTNDAV
jgi:hypothetical protein